MQQNRIFLLGAAVFFSSVFLLDLADPGHADFENRSATGTASTAAASEFAFYVSPSGSDGNDGTSSATAFATLERARNAMDGSSRTKLTYLMGGIYKRSSALYLGGRDAGEVWRAYPGETPVLEGNRSVDTGIFASGSNITIRGITIQNFIANGIVLKGVRNAVVEDNIIKNITSSSWGQAGIEISGNFTNAKILHNRIESIGYSGIELNAFPGQNIDNLTIDGNVVLNTVMRVRDGGGIYVMDRSHSAKGIRITNNVVADFGSDRGIYLDDETSNVLVANNIVYGKGRWGFQIHGGDHNTFQNNIFDVSNLSAMGLYQDISGGSGANYGMAGNVFTCNIIYASSNFQRDLWRVYGSGIEMPSVTNNNYYGASGDNLNSGAIIDSSPVKANPNFTDAGAYDYTVSNPPMSCFTPIDMSSAGPRITRRP